MTSNISRAAVAAAAAASLLVAPGFSLAASAAPAPMPAAGSVVAKPGSTGATVRTIQNDLHYLGYFRTTVNGSYGPVTTAAVKAFQKAYRLPVTGVVDATTFSRLRTTSDAKRVADKKAAAQKAAAQKAAMARIIAKPGDRTANVTKVQSALATVGLLPKSSVIGIYGPATTSAVKALQKAYGLPQTGVVNGATYYRLTLAAGQHKRLGSYNAPTTAKAAVKLDSRCLVGRTICVNKTTRKMYWVVNGSVKASYDVRVGRPSLPTREGLFHIYLKSTNWYSTLYHVNMPYTQFFSGGEAVHYSVDFATNGYSGGGSHGCVNMKTRTGAAWLYSQTKVGDRVVVYR